MLMQILFVVKKIIKVSAQQVFVCNVNIQI